jgi:hypothetical protein
MPTDRGNFEAWFVRPLECLYPKAEQFGLIIAMVTLPLLERYLRQKKNITGVKLPPEFYTELEELFPELKGQAGKFWNLCRNGLLHRSTFNGPGIYLVRDLNIPVVADRGDPANVAFRLDPVAFARKVLATISGDFEVYANSLTSPLPTVAPLTHNSTLGTGRHPQPQENPFPESLRKILLD